MDTPRPPLRPAQRWLRFGFWFGVGWFLLGQVIDFGPGGTAVKGYFIWCASFLLLGLGVPRWSYRIAALLLIVVCLAIAVIG